MSSHSQQLKELQSSLKLMRQLRGSTLFSTLLMVFGIAVVAGSFLYSITRLRPLEHQITQKQTELRAIEDQFRTLSDRKAELARDNENAKAQLETTRKEISSARVTLEGIANSPLPASAKAVLTGAISKIREAEKSVGNIETELETATETASPESGISRSQVIANLFSDKPASRIGAYNVIMDSYSTDPALIPELLTYARAHRDDQNGIYNTLVVLSHLNKAQLRPHVADIQAFAREVEPMGPRIKERVDKLLSRLPSGA